MKIKLTLVLILNSSLLLSSFGGSATWNLNPISSDWTDPANWSPATVPNGPTDVATFGASNHTDVILSPTGAPSYDLDSMVFASNASAYNLSLDFVAPLTMSGAGVVNQSALTQNIVLVDPGFRSINFTNAASAGDNVVYTVAGYDPSNFADINFYDASSAGSADFENTGTISFFDQVTAGTATFNNKAASSAHGDFGTCQFNDPGSADAGFATFINQGAAIASANGGGVFYYNSGSLRHATIVNYGGSVATGEDIGGGRIELGNHANAAQANLIAYGGTNGGDGGVIQFSGSASGGKAEVQLFGNGRLEIIIRARTAPTVSIGSLSGDGLATLGQWQLDVGNNNRD